MASPSLQPRYRLASHVHLCHTGPHVVLLDLRRDRYFGLDRPQIQALRQHIEDLREPLEHTDKAGGVTETPDARVTGESADIFQQMLSGGMLTVDSGAGHNAVRSFHHLPQTALIEGYTDIAIEVTAADVARFLTAALTATLLLRWRPLEHIVTRVRLRGYARPLALTQSGQERLQRQVALFRRLRPLLFTANNQCLFNALALSEFLAPRGFFPQWIFGVHSEPFRAHCWLQHQGIVIDDTPEHVGKFTPIMSV